METVKLIKTKNSTLYYEVRMFPNYECRIISYSQEEQVQCTDNEQLRWSAYEVALLLLQLGEFDELDVCSYDTKLLPKCTSV